MYERNCSNAGNSPYNSSRKRRCGADRADFDRKNYFGCPWQCVVPQHTEFMCREFTFSGDRTIFSCSYGRNSTKKRFLSELQVYNRADATDDTMLGELELAVALPPMVEEVEVVGDEVYMIFDPRHHVSGRNGCKGQSTCPIDKMIAVKLGLDSIK